METKDGMTEKEALIMLTEKCPKFYFGWVLYNCEVYAVRWNVKATMEAKKPMLDLGDMLVTLESGRILHTVQFDRNKFIPI